MVRLYVEPNGDYRVWRSRATAMAGLEATAKSWVLPAAKSWVLPMEESGQELPAVDVEGTSIEVAA